MKCMFNYRKLRGRIVEKYGSVTSFAEKYGVSKALMSLKLNNKAGFSQDDIVKISEMLEIEKTETADYFLTLYDVGSNDTIYSIIRKGKQ